MNPLAAFAADSEPTFYFPGRDDCTSRIIDSMISNGSPLSIGGTVAVWSVKRRGSRLTIT
jgi:hypothetical protein